MDAAKLDLLPKTPMWIQYGAIKKNALDALLFYRMGDFYELFLDDAVEAAGILGIALTARHKDLPNPVPMCGVPFHSASNYINRLLAEGKRIAICEQVTEPGAQKGIVERAIVRVVSPGIAYDNAEISARNNNYLLAISASAPKASIAYVDASTGEYRYADLPDREQLANELECLQPKEILIPEALFKDPRWESFAKDRLSHLKLLTHSLPDYYFAKEAAHEDLCRHFKVHNLEAFGLTPLSPALGAVAAVLRRLKDSERLGNLEHVQAPQAVNRGDFMAIDAATVEHLDLFPKANRSERESLLWHLDQTRSAMGARWIRAALERPLRNLEKIQARQNAIQNFLHHAPTLESIRRELDGILDLERLASKIGLKTISPRDLIGIRDSLARFEPIKKSLHVFAPNTLLGSLASELGDFTKLVQVLSLRMLEDAPNHAREGNIFRPGWHRDLDELISLSTNGVQVIAEMEARERDATGITNLKIRFNRVFGYYFEVTKSQLKLVPDRFIRKQTTANSERFITEELKSFEEKVLSAEERRIRLEAALFQETVQLVAAELHEILGSAQRLAEIDALAGLAEAAKRFDWSAPVLDLSDDLEIIDGRHPVVESLVGKEQFVKNSLHFSQDTRTWLITGPNMAGKSTFMRQVALLTLMAQLGSFIPAKSAKIGIADRIASRVGASDRIGQGQSTFMVEMNEAARILRQATEKSLLIIDEIGRGTSTFDGLALAWAILEDIVMRLRSRTLFATHYHELTALESQLPSLQNWNVAVRESQGQVLFLHHLEKGAASGSYGIQVARLAGVPAPVLERAQAVLQSLEKGEKKDGKRKRPLVVDSQMPLFSAMGAGLPEPEIKFIEKTPAYLEDLVAELKDFDLNASTPIDALLKLKGLKERLSVPNV